MRGIVGDTASKVILILLAISAFPGGCFSAFIAANSFRTTMPKVNPFLSVGIGTLVSIFLAVTGWAMQVIPFFGIIGASFGPVCGAMVADYLLSGGKWAGPRAGFNPAGWISWAAGFVVGAFNPVFDILQREAPVQDPLRPGGGLRGRPAAVLRAGQGRPPDRDPADAASGNPEGVRSRNRIR